MDIHTPTSLGAVSIADDDPVFDAIRALVVLDDVRESVQGYGSALGLVGDQKVDGHLHLEDRLVIDGSLEVSGAITISEGAGLMVRGKVTCRNFFTEGGDFMAPELFVEHVLYGAYESGWTYATKASGGVWISGPHPFEFEDSAFANEVDVEEHPPKEDTSAEAEFLSQKGLELAFIRPLACYNGDDDAEVTEEDWMEALRADEVAR